MPRPPEPPEVVQVRRERAQKGNPRAVDIAPAVKLDLSVILPTVTSEIEEFIADREAAELPLPDRQAMLDRAANILGNVDPSKVGGINSLAANRRLTFHHRDEPPYFGMGVEGTVE